MLFLEKKCTADCGGDCFLLFHSTTRQCLCPAVSLERYFDHDEALAIIEKGYDITKMLFLVISLALDTQIISLVSPCLLHWLTEFAYLKDKNKIVDKKNIYSI